MITAIVILSILLTIMALFNIVLIAVNKVLWKENQTMEDLMDKPKSSKK